MKREKSKGRVREEATQGHVAQDCSFKSQQLAFLSAQSKTPSRVPGRTRVDKIISTAISLLNEHTPQDVSIAMIATRAGMTRTSIYAHFKNVSEIFDQISIRFVEQTGQYVEQYVRGRNPKTLTDLVMFTIDGIYTHFNRPSIEEGLINLAAVVPFDARKAVKDFGKISALMYHSLWKVEWPMEPLSERDPFFILVLLQDTLFSTSIQYHGRITEEFTELTKQVALDFITGVESRMNLQKAQKPDANIEARIRAATSLLATASDPRLLVIATEQLEALARVVDQKLR